MYKINPDKNDIAKLKEETFSDLGFKEREHLQEWIAKNPDVLGEELLIIQKEFDGFTDTRERLDLLALDKQGALVVIENKLDDTGRDVTWQALKYASYCSSLSKENIRKIYQSYLDKSGGDQKAEDNIAEFLDGEAFDELILNKGTSQRLILLASNFRKEVTSTVMWLLNYNLRIQCFRATPFSLNDQLFLNVEQIIPTPDVEEYMVGMAEKAKEDINTEKRRNQREQLNHEFWVRLLNSINEKSSLFQNISPTHKHYIGTASGIRGVGLNFVVSMTYCRVEVYIDGPNKEENHYFYKELEKRKNEIEKSFDGHLVWDFLETRRACRIKAETEGNILEKDQWNEMIAFMTNKMIGLEKAFREPIAEVRRTLQ